MATTRNPVSMLAFEIGSVTTRAILFDVVEGRYRFLGTGVAPTTAVAPYNDIGEGIRLALDHLQEITGRKLVGTDQRLIIPGKADGSGVDTCVATVSAGPPLKVVAIGLLEDISHRQRTEPGNNYLRPGDGSHQPERSTQRLCSPGCYFTRQT